MKQQKEYALVLTENSLKKMLKETTYARVFYLTKMDKNQMHLNIYSDSNKNRSII